MAHLNELGLIERFTSRKGCTGKKRGKRPSRWWWLIKADRQIPVGTIKLPPEFAGKKVGVKIFEVTEEQIMEVNKTLWKNKKKRN